MITLRNDRACAVLERTADGVPVGRCWFAVDENGRCPRHGDVRAVQVNFLATGRLTDEWDVVDAMKATKLR